jgi:hypothetical protein
MTSSGRSGGSSPQWPEEDGKRVQAGLAYCPAGHGESERPGRAYELVGVDQGGLAAISTPY